MVVIFKLKLMCELAHDWNCYMSAEICGHDLHDIIDGVDLWNANFISQLRAV
jgi:hypothetical protein